MPILPNPDITPEQRESFKGKVFYRTELPGDYVISEDERSVYKIAEDGSRRRIKDKLEFKAVLHRMKELRLEKETEKAAEAAPLTAVDPKTLSAVSGLMATGVSIPDLGQQILKAR